jgi:hypothetical protein
MPRGCCFLLAAFVIFCGPLPARADPADALRSSIAALAPSVRGDEARQVADCAYRTAAQLRRDYAVVGPPLFHNFLVNTGIRKRGLCFQWAEDLLGRLDALKLSSLELHWGEARARTWREHNCVVVTARGQPFRAGIVLDCWRHSGRLYWGALAADHYPWIEDSAYAQIALSRNPHPSPSRRTPGAFATSRSQTNESQL